VLGSWAKQENKKHFCHSKVDQSSETRFEPEQKVGGNSTRLFKIEVPGLVHEQACQNFGTRKI